VPGVIPLAGAEDDAHVIEFPWVSDVRQVLVRAVEVDVIVVITVEEIADLERAAQAEEMADRVGETKGNINGMISAEARAADRDPVTRAVAPREIENVVDDHALESVVRAHAIRRVDPLVVKNLRDRPSRDNKW
jgi:hypothetical protein